MLARLPWQVRGIVFGIIVGGLLTFIGYERARAVEASVFDMYDQAVVAMVVSAECGLSDSPDMRRLSGFFPSLLDAVEARLMALNPDKPRDVVRNVIGFRTSYLERQASLLVARNGCAADETQRLALLEAPVL